MHADCRFQVVRRGLARCAGPFHPPTWRMSTTLVETIGRGLFSLVIGEVWWTGLWHCVALALRFLCAIIHPEIADRPVDLSATKRQRGSARDGRRQVVQRDRSDSCCRVMGCHPGGDQVGVQGA